MQIKKCPPWASSVVLNYRAQFKSTYGEETSLNDDQIFTIFDTVFDDDDNVEQDKARVEAMKELQG